MYDKNIEIHLVRHYPYLEDEYSTEFERLVEKKKHCRYSENALEEIRELEKKLRWHTQFENLPDSVRERISEVFGEVDRILLCYNPRGTKRETDTAQDLIRHF